MNDRFTRLNTLFEQLHSELLGAQSYSDDLEKRERQVEAGERAIAINNRENAKEKEKIGVIEAEHIREKEYLEREAVRLGKERTQIEYDKAQLEKIAIKENELAVKTEEMHKHERALEERIKSLSELVTKEQDLLKREELITKEKTVDRERKRILDLREVRIRDREAQLQLDAEILDS